VNAIDGKSSKVVIAAICLCGLLFLLIFHSPGFWESVPDNGAGIDPVRGNIQAAGEALADSAKRVDEAEDFRANSETRIRNSLERLDENQRGFDEITGTIAKLRSLTRESQSILGKVRQRHAREDPAP
jgi:hypothetical protein